MNSKNLVILVLVGIVIFLLLGMTYHMRWMHGVMALGGISGGAARTAFAQQADREGNKPIEIGVIGPWSYDAIPVTNLLRGYELACSLINERGDLGRPLLLHVRDDGLSVANGKMQMQLFCENPAISAVLGGIGYGDFEAFHPLAEFNRLPLLSPFVPIEPEMLGGKNEYSFSLYPNYEESIRTAQAFIEANGLHSVAILGPSDLYYGTYFCNAFDRKMPRDSLGQAGIADRFVYQHPIDPDMIEKAVRFWSDVIEYDTLLLAADAHTAQIVLDILAQEEEPPVVLLSDEVTHHQLAAMRVPTNLSVRLFSCYDPNDPKPANLEFIGRYQAQYGETPDWLAAQGFDTVNVLAAAIRAAGSTVPDCIADALGSINYTNNVNSAPRIIFNEFGASEDDKIILTQ